LNRRMLLLCVLIAALAVPAFALADGGTSQGGGQAGAVAGHRLTAHLERLTHRLDKRFARFSSHCLVQNAPQRCSEAASRFVDRLTKVQTRLTDVEARIKEKCGAAGAPARCASAGEVTAKIDSLLSKVASDMAAIKAQYPSA
jgi:hypothetical protein